MRTSCHCLCFLVERCSRHHLLTGRTRWWKVVMKIRRDWWSGWRQMIESFGLGYVCLEWVSENVFKKLMTAAAENRVLGYHPSNDMRDFDTEDEQVLPILLFLRKISFVWCMICKVQRNVMQHVSTSTLFTSEYRSRCVWLDCTSETWRIIWDGKDECVTRNQKDYEIWIMRELDDKKEWY